MKDIKVGVEKMTRNRRKMIEQTGDSLLLSKHCIQLSALFLLLSVFIMYNKEEVIQIKVLKHNFSKGGFISFYLTQKKHKVAKK